MPETVLNIGNLKEATSEALKKAVETSTGEAIENFITDRGQEWIAGLAGDVAGVFCSELLGALIKSLLGVQNKTEAQLGQISAKVDAIDAKLSKVANIDTKLDILLTADFRNGVRLVHQAMSLPWQTNDERLAREKRMWSAIDSLDRAFGNLPIQATEQQKFYIHLLQGLCARQITGGEPLASRLLEPIAEEIERTACLEFEAIAAFHWQKLAMPMAPLAGLLRVEFGITEVTTKSILNPSDFVSLIDERREVADRIEEAANLRIAYARKNVWGRGWPLMLGQASEVDEWLSGLRTYAHSLRIAIQRATQTAAISLSLRTPVVREQRSSTTKEVIQGFLSRAPRSYPPVDPSLWQRLGLDAKG